ncbi:hypothetical protein RFI_14807, partial [Reticulomyxa filosa]
MFRYYLSNLIDCELAFDDKALQYQRNNIEIVARSKNEAVQKRKLEEIELCLKEAKYVSQVMARIRQARPKEWDGERRTLVKLHINLFPFSGRLSTIHPDWGITEELYRMSVESSNANVLSLDTHLDSFYTQEQSQVNASQATLETRMRHNILDAQKQYMQANSVPEDFNTLRSAALYQLQANHLVQLNRYLEPLQSLNGQQMRELYAKSRNEQHHRGEAVLAIRNSALQQAYREWINRIPPYGHDTGTAAISPQRKFLDKAGQYAAYYNATILAETQPHYFERGAQGQNRAIQELDTRKHDQLKRRFPVQKIKSTQVTQNVQRRQRNKELFDRMRDIHTLHAQVMYPDVAAIHDASLQQQQQQQQQQQHMMSAVSPTAIDAGAFHPGFNGLLNQSTEMPPPQALLADASVPVKFPIEVSQLLKELTALEEQGPKDVDGDGVLGDDDDDAVSRLETTGEHPKHRLGNDGDSQDMGMNFNTPEQLMDHFQQRGFTDVDNPNFVDFQCVSPAAHSKEKEEGLIDTWKDFTDSFDLKTQKEWNRLGSRQLEAHARVEFEDERDRIEGALKAKEGQLAQQMRTREDDEITNEHRLQMMKEVIHEFERSRDQRIAEYKEYLEDIDLQGPGQVADLGELLESELERLLLDVNLRLRRFKKATPEE